MRLVKGEANQTANVLGHDLVANKAGLILPPDEASRVALLGVGFKSVDDKTLTRDPTVTDDEAHGFTAGTITHNTATATAFVCISAKTGIAIHAKIESADDAYKKLGLTSQEPDDICLIGSLYQPATFKLASGSEINLGDVVNIAFKNSRLKTAKEWNDLPEINRENFIEAAVAGLDLAAPEDPDKLGFGKGA